MIGNLVAALRAQDYPADQIDIYVAVNNTTDDTERVARSAGANVMRCAGEISCKGDVLHQAFERLMPMGYDAYAIFDADNLPDREFMQRMNDALAAGERVCKGRLKCGNYTDSWVAGSYGLYHALMELTYSRTHSAAGFSSNLVGTAFVVHREVIDALGGWNTFSLCEDTEFAAQTTRIGHRVAFVHDAMSYDEQVSKFPISLRQRHRWCYGMIQCARRMTRSMFRRTCPHKGMARDFGVLFIMSHTAPICAILGAISIFVQPAWMLPWLAAGMGCAYLGMLLLGAFLCRYGGYPMRSMIPALIGFPIFMASWILTQILALFVPVRQWHAIRHGGQREAADRSRG